MSPDTAHFLAGALIGAAAVSWNIARTMLTVRWFSARVTEAGARVREARGGEPAGAAGGPAAGGWPGAFYGLAAYGAATLLVFWRFGTTAAFAGLVVGAVVPRYIWMFWLLSRKGG